MANLGLAWGWRTISPQWRGLWGGDTPDFLPFDYGESFMDKEIADLDTSFDAQAEELNEIVVRAKSTDIHVALTGLVWLPYAADEKGRLRPAWKT